MPTRPRQPRAASRHRGAPGRGRLRIQTGGLRRHRRVRPDFRLPRHASLPSMRACGRAVRHRGPCVPGRSHDRRFPGHDCAGRSSDSAAARRDRSFLWQHENPASGQARDSFLSRRIGSLNYVLADVALMSPPFQPRSEPGFLQREFFKSEGTAVSISTAAPKRRSALARRRIPPLSMVESISESLVNRP